MPPNTSKVTVETIPQVKLLFAPLVINAFLTPSIQVHLDAYLKRLAVSLSVYTNYGFLANSKLL